MTPQVTPHTSCSPMEISRTIYPWRASSVGAAPSFPPTKLNPDSPPVPDTVKVFQYDDCSLEPPFIGPTTFFFRHTFSPKINHVTVSLLCRSTPVYFLADSPCQAFTSEEVCSICEQPYNPDVVQRFPESFTMHFCPRDSCQTAWHRQCLSTNRIKKRPAFADRKLSLLCSIPTKSLERSVSPNPSDSPPSLLSLFSKSNSASTRSQSVARKRKHVSEPDALSLFEELPSDLTELASQPIVKPTFQPPDVYEEPPKQHRGRRKAPKEPENRIHNVAGNITTVLKARVLISDVLRGTTTLPRDWKRKVGWDQNTISSIIVDDENDPCPPLLCPTCGEHI